MYFKPQFHQKQQKVFLSDACKITGADGYAKEVLSKLTSTYGNESGSIKEITVKTKLPEFFELENKLEGYAIEITDTEITLYGENKNAVVFAAVTLLQMSEHEGIYTGRLCDAPDCSFRGYRVYLPGREYFDEFKKMVDMLAYYKYNTIIIEVGGAMEYKRHPEINKAWKEFADETHKYSGRTDEISQMCNWSKNSIHTENAEGEILTQKEVRELVEYCRDRGLEPIPEVPTLSHTDYICLAHPEIAERQDDPYPDTYCPNHPDTYKIVFDIFEEVIEVFEPKVLHIGHDEMYSSCICERCRGLDPAKEYANDIIRLYEWLKERGIQTMMWGEKLLPVVTESGKFYGGAGGIKFRGEKQLENHPVLFYCQYYLPRDIIMLHWYYAFGIQYDYVYHTHGYKNVVYGNMAASKVEHWRKRREMGISGGACSNWGSNDPVYMQRNCQFINLVFGAYTLWSTDYDNDQRSKVMKAAFEECFHLKFGNLEDKPYVTVTHTTEAMFNYHPFWCGGFIDKDQYTLGKYCLEYTDGEKVYFDVVYGENISSDKTPYIIDDEDSAEFDDVTLSESALSEVSYSTIPSKADGKTYYTTAFLNPHPEKEIKEFTYQPIQDAKVIIKEVKY